MIRALALCFIACLAAAPAAAGPWAREKGGVFATVSREVRSGTDWEAFYAEYGLSERWTFVIDAGRSTEDGGWIALALLRVPLWSFGRHKFATSFGVGREHVVFPGLTEDADPQKLIDLGLMPGDYLMSQVGLSWGMQFDGGWANIDAAFRRAEVGTREERKIDATLGLNLREGGAAVAQAQFSDTLFDTPQVRLGLGWSQKFGHVGMEAGVGKRLRHGRETDAKIGFWVEF